MKKLFRVMFENLCILDGEGFKSIIRRIKKNHDKEKAQKLVDKLEKKYGIAVLLKDID